MEVSGAPDVYRRLKRHLYLLNRRLRRPQGQYDVLEKGQFSGVEPRSFGYAARLFTGF